MRVKRYGVFDMWLIAIFVEQVGVNGGEVILERKIFRMEKNMIFYVESVC